MSYNLIDCPVLPVVRGAAVEEVSIREALLGAAEITGLAATPSTMGPALLRHLLLAVLLDAQGPPRTDDEWRQRWDSGTVDAGRVESYLDKHRARFDLFSTTEPFAQVPGLRSQNGEVKGASLLVPSISVGNGVPIFGTRTEGDPVALTSAEAARWLIHLLAWDTAGIKSAAEGDPQTKGGKNYGNRTGPLGQLGLVVPVGRNLFETLMLNLKVVNDGADPADRPHWDRSPLGPTWEQREASGPLDLLTWVGRRVRLHPEVVDDEVVVRSVVVAGGDRLTTTPDYEPHTVWRNVKNPKADDPPARPRRYSSDKASWQGLGALLSVAGADRATEFRTSPLLQQLGRLQAVDLFAYDYPLQVELISCEYGSQSAVVENLVADSLPIPLAALRADGIVGETVESMAESGGGLVDAINLLHGDLRRAAGGDPIPWNSGQRPGSVLVQRLDPLVRRILAGLQQEPDRVPEARDLWFEVARSVADRLRDELMLAVPLSAHAGREATVGGKSRMFRAASAELSYAFRRNKALAAFSPTEPAEIEVTG